MKFRYIGDSDSMRAYGYDFRNGNEPDVTDATAIKRLSGNRYFEALPEEEDTKQPDTPFVADVIAEAQMSIVEGAPALPQIVAVPARKKPGRKPKTAATE